MEINPDADLVELAMEIIDDACRDYERGRGYGYCISDVRELLAEAARREREACAEIAEDQSKELKYAGKLICLSIAEAIRARGDSDA